MAIECSGPAAALKTLRRAIPKAHVKFLSSFADSASFGDYLFVHAGIRPGVPIAHQSPQDLRWIRHPFLEDETDHGRIVVHGHTISETADMRPNRIGIDTGAYRTGVLTALGLEGPDRWLLQTEQARIARRGRSRCQVSRRLIRASICRRTPFELFSIPERDPHCRWNAARHSRIGLRVDPRRPDRLRRQGHIPRAGRAKRRTVESGYRIAPMDTVSVKVFRMPDLSGDYQVDLTGQISMPLIGEVRVVDMTTAQLDDQLTRKFGEKYLENPDISVGLKDSARRKITVDGAVKSAGAFPSSDQMSLMQAIALAGGVSEDANTRRIAVFRTIDGKRQAAAFDLASIRRGEVTDPKIYPGDIIVVDGSGVKAAYKQILNSFPILSIFRPF